MGRVDSKKKKHNTPTTNQISHVGHSISLQFRNLFFIMFNFYINRFFYFFSQYTEIVRIYLKLLFLNKNRKSICLPNSIVFQFGIFPERILNQVGRDQIFDLCCSFRKNCVKMGKCTVITVWLFTILLF